MKCRFCGSALEHTFADLGMSPLANSYPADGADRMEPFYPLRAYVCGACYLVQLDAFQTPEDIFGDYAYFSSYSDTWLNHSRDYVREMIERFGLGPESLVVEVASNDGYLLRYFQEKGVPVLGVEPARNVALVAMEAGVPTVVEFFGEKTAGLLAEDGKRADLLVGNNVLAHVPDLNDFVRGMKALLKPGGVITMEFPHLMRLIEGNQFDTIYHEHFSYFSFMTVKRVFNAHGLCVFDVEELPTHGGSIRIYACHSEDGSKTARTQVNARVKEMLDREAGSGFASLELYLSFDQKVKETKRDILDFLIGIKRAGKRMAGYGAPAKGNTLLNYCGIRTDFIDFTVDRSPGKQGRRLPGTRIPICQPGRIMEARPDYLVILPWNIKEEVMEQMACIRGWGGKFIVLIPEPRVLS